MKIKKHQRRIFLVLVPHRDTRLELRRYSGILFKAGYTGAYNFPWVAPLAVLSRWLDNEELKTIAHKLREASTKSEDKFITDKTAVISFYSDEEKTMLFGPGINLDCNWYNIFKEKNINADFFTPSVIGACLLSEGENIDSIPPPPPLSFRAAAVANMIWQPLHGINSQVIGYKWEIGKPRWLPKKKTV